MICEGFFLFSFPSAAEMDEGWGGGKEEGSIARSGVESPVVI